MQMNSSSKICELKDNNQGKNITLSEEGLPYIYRDILPTLTL
jgi:hypothetical protein